MSLVVEDPNGVETRSCGLRMAPHYYWVSMNGTRVFTLPVVRIDPNQTATVAVEDVLKKFRGQSKLRPGLYKVWADDVAVWCDVGSTIEREGLWYPLWVTRSSIGRIEMHALRPMQIEISGGGGG